MNFISGQACRSGKRLIQSPLYWESSSLREPAIGKSIFGTYSWSHNVYWGDMLWNTFPIHLDFGYIKKTYLEIFWTINAGTHSAGRFCISRSSWNVVWHRPGVGYVSFKNRDIGRASVMRVPKIVASAGRRASSRCPHDVSRRYQMCIIYTSNINTI